MDNNIDKWGSLSMPERASLISLFTGSGVTSLDEMRALYNKYGNGGGIHIDPSKKGTFTSAAKRHGMGVQEFASRVLSNKDDYSTAMVRKANFARNAAKWHWNGGLLDNGVTTDYQFNDVLPNGSIDNISENANYAAYGNDFSDSFKFGLDYERNISNNTKSNSDFIIVNDFGNGKYHDNKIPTDNAETYFARQVNNIVNQQHNDIYKRSDAYIGELIRKKYGDNIKRLQGELYDQRNFVDKGIRLGKNNKIGDIQKFLVSKKYLTDKDVDGILGKKTITAIQKYLNYSGYNSGEPDGIIGGKDKGSAKSIQ